MTQWPHAPAHQLSEQGNYIVTAGTYQKKHHINTPGRKDFFLNTLFQMADQYSWKLQAWSVLSNHYHIVASAPETPSTLPRFIGRLHEVTAKTWNKEDNVSGRKIWHNYRESRITYQASYLARLKYVHDNPQHHGVVKNASNYKWCSRAWIENHATPAFIKTLDRFKTDKLSIQDDY